MPNTVIRMDTLLFDSHASPMILCNPRGGTILAVNKAFAQITNIRPEKLKGISVGASSSPALEKKLLQIHRSISGKGSVKRCLWSFAKKKFDSSLEVFRTRYQNKGVLLIKYIDFKERISLVKDEVIDVFRDSHFKPILDKMISGVMVVDTQEKIIYANERAGQILGWSKEGLYGRLLSQCFDYTIDEAGKSLPFDRIPIVYAMKRQQQVENMVIGVGRKGSPHWLSMNAAPLFEGKDKLYGAVASFIDFTRLRNSKELLEKSENDHRAILNASTEANFFIDYQYRVVLFNSVAQEYVKKIFDMEIKIGEDIRHFSPLNFSSTLVDGLQKAFQGEVVRMESEMAFPGDYDLWVYCRFSPVYAKDETIMGISLSLSDISERKEAEEEVLKKEDQLRYVAKIASIGEWEFDLKSKKTWWSDEVCRIHEESPGYTPPNDNPFLFFTPESRSRVHSALRKCLKDNENFDLTLQIESKTGKARWIRTTGTTLRKEGKPVKLIGLCQDITERKLVEEELTRQNALLSKLTSRMSLATRSGKIGVWEWNIDNKDVIWDEQAQMILGIRPGVKSNHFQLWRNNIHPDDWPKLEHILERAIETHEPYETEMRWKKSDGQLAYLGVYGLVTTWGDGTKTMTGVVSDVTERKLAEISLQKTEKQYKQLFNSSPLPNILFDKATFQILDINEAAILHYRYRRDQFLKKSILDLRPVKEHPKLIEEFEKSRVTSYSIGKNILSDGSLIDVEVYRHQIQHEGREAVISTVIDVTEQNKLKEEENKLNHIITETVNEIYIIDKTTLKFLFVNNRTLKNLQYTLVELQQLTPLDIKKDMDYDTFMDIATPLLNGEVSRVEMEAVHYRKDGTRYDNQLILQNLDENRIIVMGEDISERKNYIESLEKLIKQKDTLVKEIHHRIKNNLQLISSIIYLKSNTLNKGEVRQFLNDTRNKIKSVALIHEQLLQSEELDQVDINEYLNQLVDDIRRSQFREDVDIRIQTHIESHSLKLDASIYCGLIVNELVINAIKHAFQGRAGGTIEIRFYKKELQCSLQVCDDGGTLPEEVLPGSTSSFGMQLLDIFVKQLRGEILIKRDKGTQFLIQFQPEEK